MVCRLGRLQADKISVDKTSTLTIEKSLFFINISNGKIEGIILLLKEIR